MDLLVQFMGSGGLRRLEGLGRLEVQDALRFGVGDAHNG